MSLPQLLKIVMTDNDFIDPDQIHEFVKTRPDYYVREFQKINNSTRFVFSLNLAALLFGSIWFGIRNIWNWALAFLLIVVFGGQEACNELCVYPKERARQA